MIHYKSPSNKDMYDFTSDVLSVHGKETRKISNLYAINHRTCILAYEENKCIGYILFFPITTDFGQKICDGSIKSITCDSIPIKEIENEYSRNKDQDIVITAIEVLSEYQGRGICNRLMERLFLFLSNEIQIKEFGKEKKYTIKNVYAFASTELDKMFYESAGFERQTKPSSVMCYKYDDFLKTNLYLFVPFIVEDGSIEFKDNEDNDPYGFIKEVDDKSKEEFLPKLSKKLRRRYIGKAKFLIKDDKAKGNVGEINDVKIYVTAYNNRPIRKPTEYAQELPFCNEKEENWEYPNRSNDKFYIAILVFTGITFEPTSILNQASILRKGVDGDALLTTEQSGGEASFNKCMEKMLCSDGKSEIKIKVVGHVRSITSLTKRPEKTHLAYMLACESYRGNYIDKDGVHPLVTPKFLKNAKKNITLYDFSEIYVSERSIVYVLSNDAINENKREYYDSLIIYIVEILMLRLCSVLINFDEIIEYLESMDFEKVDLEKIVTRFSNAALLSDISNHRFLPAKQLSLDIAEEFGLNKLEKEYYSKLEALEKLQSMRAEKRVQKYSRKTQRFALFISIISGISALSNGKQIFDAVNEGKGILVQMLMLAVVLGAISLILAKFLFPKDENKKTFKERVKIFLQRRTAKETNKS